MRLHVYTWGKSSAPPLVCLHGITASGRQFRGLAEEYLAERFYVLAPSLRGHGESGWEPPWNIETHVNDLLETLEREPATWIGHSFGGRLILELAARRPHLVRRAVLLEPVVQISAASAAADAELAFEDRSFASVEEAVADAVGAYPRAPRELVEQEAPDQLERGRDGRWRRRFSRPAYVTALSEMTRPPPRPELLNVPTLLVLAEVDSAVMPRQVEAYARALGDLIDVVYVPGRHSLFWEALTEMAEAIVRFHDRSFPSPRKQ
jgi:lipase